MGDGLGVVPERVMYTNAAGTGIYWVYFTCKHSGGHELKLQAEASTREGAIRRAEHAAEKMGFGWKYSHTEACR